jgi:hypothetical protein
LDSPFLNDRPVEITPEILNAPNAEHAHHAASRPRAETIADLATSAKRTSDFIRGLTDEQPAAGMVAATANASRAT